MAAGIHVAKPTRFGAVRFAVEYDLHMDVLPGDDPVVLGKTEPMYAEALPNGCTAKYYTGPEYDPGNKARGKPPKWNPHPKPDPDTKCRFPHFVPMGCHKCWRWNVGVRRSSPPRRVRGCSMADACGLDACRSHSTRRGGT